MTPILKIAPGVKMKGLQPMMCVVLDVVPGVFAMFGHDCWLTSAVRNGDKGKHGSGEALDFDSSTDVPHERGKEIAARAKGHLGIEFDCVWHGPRFHLHCEFDPKE